MSILVRAMVLIIKNHVGIETIDWLIIIPPWVCVPLNDIDPIWDWINLQIKINKVAACSVTLNNQCDW